MGEKSPDVNQKRKFSSLHINEFFVSMNLVSGKIFIELYFKVILKGSWNLVFVRGWLEEKFVTMRKAREEVKPFLIFSLILV